MTAKLGADADEVVKRLSQEGIPRHFIRDAMEIAQQQGGFKGMANFSLCPHKPYQPFRRFSSRQCGNLRTRVLGFDAGG